jgi:D-threonate/D-erythronate kinase
VVIPTNPTVLIIADDLTGAADSTTAFARHGFRTRVIVDITNWSQNDINGYDVVAFNTQTRNLPKEKCVEIVVALARQLAILNPRLILKKIDSTFRGQVLTETLAMLNELGLERVVIAPAHPSQKRSISRGAIFVDGIPLRDTTYARHPAPPPIDIPAAIREIFGDVLVFSGLSTQRLPEVPPAGIFLPDVSQEEDLTRIARWVIAQGSRILPVGSAGLAHAFARFLVPPIRSHKESKILASRDEQKVLIVVGSTLPAISNQIQTLTSTRKDVAVIDAANGTLIDVDISAIEETIIVLRIVRGSTLVTREEAAVNLADTTRQFLDNQPVSHMISVGGDTSFSVLRRLGVLGFDVLSQEVIGLPRGEMMYNDRPITFIAKPAGFSRSSVFALMAEELLPRKLETIS